ncbi:vitamin K epoxide reductase family protein [Synechococcus sp. MU1642]|uniref:vitamin K epoxide reductase family protein n=1 Tax=Synechococcus sp. MU1642 TaxID=2508348 RepID=UPI001CF906F0|nr:vitamin K epoxide reductase family protein [Synechococcus sp. MU1642]MCB4408215.1 vitamin K epoxide reductase family protein [Synechococcus sp. MU1642]
MGTTRLISRRRQDSGAKWSRIAMAVLATAGLIDTGSITLKRWGLLGNLTCPMGADGCDKVLNSAWGTLFAGIPLSMVGVLAYGAVLLMALLPLLPGLQENKSDLSRRTWWGLFTVSLAMAVFSGVLLGVMMLKIQAFCFFCVLSAGLSLALFVLSIVGGGWDDLGQLLFRGVLLALTVLLGGLIWASVVDPNRPEAVASGSGVAPLVTTKSTPASIALAEHLTSSGAVMYSAYWCPHCHEQKELFGKEASDQLKVVECAPDGENNQVELCRSKGLEGFPSWEINGSIDSGVKGLDALAELSGYKGDTEF